jgi:hypothetical protein
MNLLRYSVLFVCIAFIGCRQSQQPDAAVLNGSGMATDSSGFPDSTHYFGGEALLLTRFTSLAQLKEVVDVKYLHDLIDTNEHKSDKPRVQLTYRRGDRQVISVLESGISQADFIKAKKGDFWNKVSLGLRSPFAVRHRKDLGCIENLGRRKPEVYGIGDAAFYDLAEIMVMHISKDDLPGISEKDLGEKGYLNTFNHITAQAFMTSVFSEEVADFVADVHELYNMPELITGTFTQDQIEDFENGPVDNYVDMINNEWGQELGKVLAGKYKISRQTVWTPVLLRNYLNDIQSYHSWTFQIGFEPFRTSDEKVIRFAKKINQVMDLE